MSLEFKCVICTEPVPEDRAKRGADTCGKECAKKKAKMVRDWRASKSCRLCGRRARKPRTMNVLTEQGALISMPVAEAAQVNA